MSFTAVMYTIYTMLAFYWLRVLWTSNRTMKFMELLDEYVEDPDVALAVMDIYKPVKIRHRAFNLSMWSFESMFPEFLANFVPQEEDEEE